MQNIPRMAVEETWRSHVDSRPSSKRWTWSSATNAPVRQRIPTSNSQIFERVFSQNGQWKVDRGGQVKNILTIEQYVYVFWAEWMSSRRNYSTARQWGDYFGSLYSGVIREDVEFLVRIQVTGRLPQFPQNPPPQALAQAPQQQRPVSPRPPPTPPPMTPSASIALPFRPSPSRRGLSSSASSTPGAGPSRLSQAPFSPPTNSSATIDKYISFPEAGKEQEDLYNDPRRYELLDNYQKVRDDMAGKRPEQETHLERLSQQALYLFSNGRPATPWTVGMPEQKMKEADYLLLTEAQHMQFIKKGLIHKPIVLRDAGFRARRSGITRDSFFRNLKMLAGKMVHVQDLALPVNKPSARPADVVETVNGWQGTATTFSNENPPINLLNISDKTAGVTPLGIAQEYNLLAQACMYSFGNHIGKQHLETTAADFSNCTKFRILAQRGAVSSFHIDNCGVATWVTMEALMDDDGEEDKDCVKYWFIVPMHLFSTEERRQALQDFAREGTDWQPRLKYQLPSISLIRGDTLIMPPGTIHAPVTLTDCFFVGGMCMHPRSLPDTLKVWQFLSRNENCTNEAQPAQARAVLDYINNAVHDEPSRYGYTNDQLGDLDRLCNEILDRTNLRCECKTGCSRRCSCSAVGQRCGPRCHLGVRCKNPCGSHQPYPL